MDTDIIRLIFFGCHLIGNVYVVRTEPIFKKKITERKARKLAVKFTDLVTLTSPK